MKIKRIALVGGSGFVGRHLTRHLQNHGYACRVITRHPHRHRDLASFCEVVAADPYDHDSLVGVLRDCDAVINLAGILNSDRKMRTFRRVHVELVENIVASCRTADDSFLNRFATLLKIPGPLPLACPNAKLSPVFIDDVVEAFARALEDPATFARHYELCGPKVYTLKELVQLIAEELGRNKLIVPLPDWASRLQANVLQYVPGKPFTPDNYLSLQTDSVCHENGFEQLGIQPTSLYNAGRRILANDEKNHRLDRLRRDSGRQFPN